MPDSYYHSVLLIEDKCKGCTNCIKTCPTEAIRVRDGKAFILQDLCIDCGECIRTCPNNAKAARSDDLNQLKKFKHTVAMPAPAFYGQFSGITKRENILNSLLDLGFDSVFEVALAAEATALAIKEYLTKTKIKPVISQACPAVVGIIQVKFPTLIKNIVPVPSPMNIAARMAKEEVSKETGLSLNDIGCFFISPCPAKISSSHQPVGEGENFLDGAFAMDYIYGECLKLIDKNTKDNNNSKASSVGLKWGFSGGEAESLDCNSISVDGIHNVIKLLEAVEQEELNNLDYIECQACIGGCVGGCLTPKNHYVSKSNLKEQSLKASKVSNYKNYYDIKEMSERGYFDIKSKIHPREIKPLDYDLKTAINKMELLEKTLEGLPGLDCGSCGAPSCRALAEDIVRGYATEMDCVFKLRERVAELADEVAGLAKKMPPAMGKNVKKNSD